eukprot:TRINITY_DN47652_c0_g1_i1.p1 TRINITY_DN47652_c0_g1~~TRINITY_DN47652_c0_g1_i1.p1  ORF type:complete len:496 (+),score=92.70 TRINITY_DN47652_c0_g1_i1:47-1489(+)
MRLAAALAYLWALLTVLPADALIGVSTEIHADARQIEAIHSADVKRKHERTSRGRLDIDEVASSSHQSPDSGSHKSWLQRLGDELLSQKGTGHLESRAVLALWSSMQLIAASLCGLAAVHVCDRAQKSSIELLRLQDSGADWRTYLRQMPESISRSIHLTNSPYGTVFKALLICSAVLLLNSDYPKHDLFACQWGFRSWGFFWTIFCSIRGCLPTLGILSEVFIPMSDALVLVRERFKRPEHKVTDEDKYVFLESRFQEKMHILAGLVTFMAVPAVEGVAVAFSFISFFSGEGDEMVHWKDDTLCAYVWLAILIMRVLTILTSDVCMLNMAYEGWMDTRYLHNPFFMYIPERQAVNSLFNYILLMGFSIWFVSESVWQGMSPAAKVFAFSLTVVTLISVLVWIVRVFMVLCNKRKNLTGNRHKNLVSGIIEEQKRQLQPGSSAMEELDAVKQMYEEAGLAALDQGLESDEDENVDPIKST